jgi:hypothetical protein
MSNNVAPLSSRLFMIPRELPSYLSTAYSMRYKDVPAEGNLLYRIGAVVWRCLTLLKELLVHSPSYYVFHETRQKLEQDFALMNQQLAAGSKPLCAYFVSSRDNNGAILGNQLYYYHHYKIKQLQNHYDVAAAVVTSIDDLKQKLEQFKALAPQRVVKMVDIVCHGNSKSLDLGSRGYEVGLEGEVSTVQANDFAACAEDAVIVLDACSTAMGQGSIAETIAKENKGKTVIAPEGPLYFSKPVFEVEQDGVKLAHLVHGFAIVKAYTAKQFRYI